VALRDGGRALKANRAQLQAVVNEIAPGLTDRRGIGPVTAAQAIVSFSHPGRCRSDAAFATLAGTSPLPASSGRTVRHRLNRGGDRALNSAIHTIALTRMRSCPRTQTYIAAAPPRARPPARSGGASSANGQAGRGGFLLKRKAMSLRCRRERLTSFCACRSRSGGASWCRGCASPPASLMRTLRPSGSPDRGGPLWWLLGVVVRAARRVISG
jgi:hypothetical protein